MTGGKIMYRINKILKKPIKERIMKKHIKRFFRYVKKPSNDFALLVCALHKKWTILPTDLYLDDGGMWINLGDKKIILFNSCYEDNFSYEQLVAMTIEDEPQIIPRNATIELRASDIDKIKIFVKTYKVQLIQLGNWKSDKTELIKLLEKDNVYNIPKYNEIKGDI
jgi:hypothetical protein